MIDHDLPWALAMWGCSAVHRLEKACLEPWVENPKRRCGSFVDVPLACSSLPRLPLPRPLPGHGTETPMAPMALGPRDPRSTRSIHQPSGVQVPQFPSGRKVMTQLRWTSNVSTVRGPCSSGGSWGLRHISPTAWRKWCPLLRLACLPWHRPFNGFFWRERCSWTRTCF